MPCFVFFISRTSCQTIGWKVITFVKCRHIELILCTNKLHGMSRLMRLWHLSPSVNSIFKHACAAICNNDYGVNTHASAADIQISVFYREFPESLGTSKMRVKFQYLVHKSRKRSQRFCIHINEIYINFIRIKFCRNPISALTDCLQMDARLQIKLNISEYYVRFNKATIGNMAVSFR